jgi:membrane-associated protease RseP (regulator of RpoE activity)
MSQNTPVPPNSGIDSSVTLCTNCHSPMPSGLRFCRNCGYRLGEGLAEYTETVRFQNGHNGAGVKTATAPTPNYQTNYGLGGGPIAANAPCNLKRRRHRRMSGMNWMFLALFIFFGTAGGVTTIVRQINHGINGRVSAPSSPRSFVGVNQFETTDGGVTFSNVEPPGSPADKAGLVGGDIITSFDGQKISDSDEMMSLLRKTPIGKIVEVVFVRDGETKTTKLTTISEEDAKRLEKEFSARPGGHGRFGIDNQERVEIPGTNLHGVRLGSVEANLPADMAGLKKGDIVIAIDDVPIRTSDELDSRIQRAVPYTTVVVKIIRGADHLEIPVKVGRRS